MSDEPRVLKHLRFEYITPEFARPDFKLPSEEDPKKEGEPMDEELFTEEVVNRLAEIEDRMSAFEDALVSQSLRTYKIDSKDEVGWRFYEVEKRVEELEKMLIAHRRFTVYFLACLYAVSLAIALWIVSLHG